MDIISRAMATLKSSYPDIDAPCLRKEFLNDRLHLAMRIAIEEYRSAVAVKDIEVKTDETILRIEGPGIDYMVGQLLEMKGNACTEDVTEIYRVERPGPYGPMTIFRIWAQDKTRRRAAKEINAAAVTTVTFERETP